MSKSVTSVHGLILMLQRMPPDLPVLLFCDDGPEGMAAAGNITVSEETADAWTDGLEVGEQYCQIGAETT